MRKLDPNILAVASIFGITALLIAGMYFASFERNHTHDKPNKQGYSQSVTSPENDMVAGGLVKPEGRSAKSRSNSPQNYSAYTDTQSLQNKDHKAQVLMAVFTGVGLLIGLAGLYLIYRTLLETGGAAKSAAGALDEAKKATREAKRATDVVESSFLIKDRAFVTFKSFECVAHFNPDKTPTHRYTIYPIWLNTGNTPAIKMIGKVNIVTLHDDLPQNFTFPDLWEGRTSTKHYARTLAPNVDLWAQHVNVDFNELGGLKKGKFFIYGWCEYNDVFSEIRHRTEFADFIIPMGTREDGSLHFRYNLCNRHNGSDETSFRPATNYQHPES